MHGALEVAGYRCTITFCKKHVQLLTCVHVISAQLWIFAGGVYRNWKKRYFVLCGTTLTYYAREEDTESKGVVDLTTGRGVRTKDQCTLEDWPKEAKASLTFGVATESRTYYLYGTDKEEVRCVATTQTVEAWIF